MHIGLYFVMADAARKEYMHSCTCLHFLVKVDIHRVKESPLNVSYACINGFDYRSYNHHILIC